jgi:hypothetical protein
VVVALADSCLRCECPMQHACDHLSRIEDSTRDPFVALFLLCAIGLLVSIGVTIAAGGLDPTMFVQG